MDIFQTNDYTFHVSNARRSKRTTQISLKLTSMIDMFTILLVFLLKSYSAEGEIMSVSPDLKLPESSAQKSPQTASIISVTSDLIMLDGHEVAKVSNIMRSNQNLIPRLLSELKTKKELSEKVKALSSSDINFNGKISIQGDRELPYIVIKKIMFTCGKIGYNDIMLAVTMPD